MSEMNTTGAEAIIFEGHIILVKDGYGLVLSSRMLFGRHPIWGPACTCCCRSYIERLESFAKDREINLLFEGDSSIDLIFGESSFSLLEMMSFFTDHGELLRALEQFPPEVID